jgi:uncharacterized tellurite resistance protein B-like protein
MIGFYEHQYLSYKTNHIKNLLALAKADGTVHEKERDILFKLGKRYGLKDRQISALIESNEKFEIHIPDNHNDKMNVLFDVMLMVYADGVVEKQEIAFCENLVKKFGYKKQIVKWMLEDVFDKGAAPNVQDWKEIKEEGLEFVQ